MAERIVEIKLKATDEATPVLTRVSRVVELNSKSMKDAMGGMGAAADGAAAKANRLENEWRKTSSAMELAALGIGRLRSMLVATAFGAAAAAAAYLTSRIIQQARSWFDASAELQKYRQALDEQARSSREGVAHLQEIQALLFANIRAQSQYILLLQQRGAADQFIDGEIRRLKDLQREYNISARALMAIQETAGKGRPAPEFDEAARQEAEGRNIVAATRFRLSEQERLMREHGQVQMVLGRQIVDAELARQQELALTQQSLGMHIVQQELQRQEQIRQIEGGKTAARRASLQAAISFTEALNTFAGGKSRALFNLNKAASISQATIDAYAAFNAALKGPPGPPWSYAIAAAALSMGLANVARIGATPFGGGGGGGGSAGGGSAPAMPSQPPQPEISSRSDTPLPQQVTVYVYGNLVDLNDLSRELRPYNIQLGRDTI